MSEVEKLLPFSCKIEADQKCLKISTHTYSDVPYRAVDECVDMFVRAKQLLEEKGFKVAPL